MESPDRGILRALRAAGAHVAGGELAAEIHATPGVVAERVAVLKGAGYDIEEHPHFGYRFIAAPDRLIADDLAGMLEGVPLAREIIVFEKTGSTNDLAARMGREGAGEGLVIFAEEQDAGRGRLGRRWESESRMGLWFSVLLRPAFSAALWTRLTTWAAVAVAQAVEQETGCRAMIKWPNDIYIAGKKVTGILIESHFDKEQAGFAVLGIGVNVNHTAFPAELEGKASSLRLAAGSVLDRQKIAAAILRNLGALHASLEDDFPRIIAAAESRNYLKGKWIKARAGASEIEGEAAHLDAQGGLVLRLPDGSAQTIASGEVTLAVSE